MKMDMYELTLFRMRGGVLAHCEGCGIEYEQTVSQHDNYCEDCELEN